MVGDGADGTPRFRVGINTGPAVVGNVGSEEMHNFLAIGDTTNVAARLQTLAPPGSVVVGQTTYDLVRDSVDVRSLGTPDLKGKSLPIEAFELVGIPHEPNGEPRSRSYSSFRGHLTRDGRATVSTSEIEPGPEMAAGTQEGWYRIPDSNR